MRKKYIVSAGVSIAIASFSIGFFAKELRPDFKTLSRSDVILPGCKAFFDYNQLTDEAKILKDGRYYLHNENHAGKNVDSELPDYMMFVDCYSPSADYNYGVYNKKRNLYYYLGKASTTNLYSLDSDTLLATGDVHLMTVTKAGTAGKRLVFMITGGDLSNYASAEVDFSTIKNEKGMLVAKKIPFTGKAYSERSGEPGDVSELIDLYPGNYPTDF